MPSKGTTITFSVERCSSLLSAFRVYYIKIYKTKKLTVSSEFGADDKT